MSEKRPALGDVRSRAWLIDVTRRATRPFVVVVALSLACHHPRAVSASAASRPESAYCWWAVQRTALRPDSVASAFARAYASLGLANARSSRAADTSWTYAGPSSITEGSPGATYAARAVAYAHGDSTRFRHFVAVIARPGGWRTPDDSTAASARLLPLCVAIARAAAVPSVQPRAPTGEEGASVWDRGP